MSGTDPRATPSGSASTGAAGVSPALRRELLADHSARPRHAGRLAAFDVEAQVDNPVCGDRVLVRVRFDGQRLAAISQEVLGCSLARASASMMAELVHGGEVREVVAVSDRVADLVRRPTAEGPDADDLGDALALAGVGRYPARVRCALLAWEALARARALADPDR